jgi:hypothetical protein
MIDPEMFKMTAEDFVKIASANGNEAWCTIDHDHSIMLIGTYPESVSEQAHEILLDANNKIVILLNSVL